MWSAVAPVFAIILLSNASASSNVWSAAYASDWRSAPSATVGPAASRTASWRTSSARLSAGTTCVASPSASDSSALTVRGLYSSSSALARPTSRWRV